MKRNSYACRAGRRVDYELMRCAGAASHEHGSATAPYTRSTATGRQMVNALLKVFLILALCGMFYEFL